MRVALLGPLDVWDDDGRLPVRGIVRHGEWILATLEPYGLDPSTTMHVQISLYSYVRGVAINLEAEVQAEAETGLTQDEWLDTQERAYAELTGSGDFPAFTHLLAGFGEQGFDFDLAGTFEFGLRAFLNGLADVIERPR